MVSRAVALPDTPAGRQAAWFVEQSANSGRGLTVEEIAEHMRLREPWVPEHSLERFREDAGVRVVGVEDVSPHELVAKLVFDRQPDRLWVATFRVDEEPPHAITWLQIVRDLGEGVVIREAAEADGPALADLERRSPIAVGSASVTYDRGDDFFAFARLMEENVCLVVERDGEPLALNCGALHTIHSEGKAYRTMLAHHTRIPPEHHGKGYFNAVNQRLFQTYAGRMDAEYAFVAVDNAAAARLGGPGRWSFPALRCVLDCAALAGAPAGRPASEGDAARLAGILNACHEGEALFTPYTADSLRARLERAPELYTWERVWLADGAAAGVWPSGLRVAREADGRREESTRAAVLDYGYLPGAEEELQQLLRAWCGWLAERGTTELAVMTSEGSPGYPVVSGLAARTDAFDFRMRIPEPADAAQRGLYVDPIYF